MSTSPTTLHERLRAELDRRLAAARAAEAAAPSPWNFPYPPWDCIEDRDGTGVAYDVIREETGPYVALHDPADAIRRYEGELEVLERHAPGYPGGQVDYDTHTERTESGQYVEVRNAEPVPPYYCEWCDEFQPCPEIGSLASRLGVSVDG